MARTQLKSSWVTDVPFNIAKHRLAEFLNQCRMRIVSERSGEIVADQGSELITRFVGGWFINPALFPKRTLIRLHPSLHPRERGIKVKVVIEETLTSRLLDPIFKRRYEFYFKEWMSALRSQLPDVERLQ